MGGNVRVIAEGALEILEKVFQKNYGRNLSNEISEIILGELCWGRLQKFSSLKYFEKILQKMSVISEVFPEISPKDSIEIL